MYKIKRFNKSSDDNSSFEDMVNKYTKHIPSKETKKDALLGGLIGTAGGYYAGKSKYALIGAGAGSALGATTGYINGKISSKLLKDSLIKEYKTSSKERKEEMKNNLKGLLDENIIITDPKL